MEPNPYESSKADAIMHDVQATKARRFKTGARMAAIAVVLPLVAWLLAQAFVAMVASIDHVPNQGAMVLAFLSVVASVVAAVVLFVGGAALALLNWPR